MRSAYDLAKEAVQKCGTSKYNPQEYALSRSANEKDKELSDLWKKAAELLEDWLKPH